MRQSIRIKVMLTVMAVAGFYLVYSSITSTPKHSLRQITKAYERHDPVLLQKYVNMERLAGNVYEQMMMVGDGREQYSDWDTVGEPSGNMLVAFMKSRIVETTTGDIVDFIRTGRFDEERILKSGGPDFSLLGAWREYCGNQTAFDGIDYIRKRGNVAHAGLKLLQEDDAVFILDLVMEYRGGHWCITEISNFSDYLKQNFEMEANRLAKRDTLIAGAMQQALVVKSLAKSNTPGGIGIGKNVIFELELINRGSDAIDEYTVEIVCKSMDGEELGLFIIDSMDDLKPGETGTDSLYKYINTHVRGDRILYDLPQSGLDITTRIQYVKFAERKPLKLAKQK